MADRRYYVICDDGCRFESMTKEQIIAAITEATGATPGDIDDAFISKLKEQNANGLLMVWRGTQAEYNALAEKDESTLYFVGSNLIMPADEAVAEVRQELNAVASKAKAFRVYLPKDNWTGDAAPYRQTVTVSGMTDNWIAGVPVIDPGANDVETLQKEQEALACISQIISETDKLTFICYEMKPTHFVTVRIPGVLA